MATIPKHTEMSVQKYNISDRETINDIFLIHEFIDRIKYIGPSLVLRALSHNTWFIKNILPLYIDWCPLISTNGKTNNRELLTQVGKDHLYDDFKGNTLSIPDIFNTDSIPNINQELRRLRCIPELKEIVMALMDSGIAYVLIGFNGFVSTYLLHGLLAIHPKCHNKNIYIFVKELKKIIGNINLNIEEITEYMKDEIPYLNNGFTFKVKNNEPCNAIS